MRFRLRTFVLPALFAVLALSGCANRTVYVPVDTGGGGGMASVTLMNRTGTAIHYVYISPCSSDSWGEDQLGSSEVIMPGTARSFSLGAGCWDLKATFSDDREVEERGVTMSSGGTREWSITGS